MTADATAPRENGAAGPTRKGVPARLCVGVHFTVFVVAAALLGGRVEDPTSETAAVLIVLAAAVLAIINPFLTTLLDVHVGADDDAKAARQLATKHLQAIDAAAVVGLGAWLAGIYFVDERHWWQHLDLISAIFGWALTAAAVMWALQRLRGARHDRTTAALLWGTPTVTTTLSLVTISVAVFKFLAT